MNRAPLKPPRSPGAPRPPGRFPSPASCWGFPGPRSPYGGSGYRGQSPRGCAAHSPDSPVFSSHSSRGHWDRSPGRFGSGYRGFGGSPRCRGDGFRGPRSFSPGSASKLQSRSSDAAVDKYFSPSMLKDPWAELKPLTNTDAATGRRTRWTTDTQH
ncbi:M-phase-specific PLK1-interacting protein [Solea solea]|uniref:M-phase-specific PLK1-interacting protein n=1 Tax=Solea solea TaxID=90069 RepID=UPI00272B93AF|nr:M-phase-specific PLK1-interacting protein [Solea solea]